jgi:phosphoglycerate dehydrogenase-like enzyme
VAKVLIPFPLPEAMLQQMQAALPPEAIVEAAPTSDPQDVIRCARDADILIVAGESQRLLTREFLAAAPRLRFVQSLGAGYDGIDIGVAAEAGVPVASTPGVNAESVAEHTILLMLALLKRFMAMEQATRDGGWADVGAVQNSIGDLAGATVGLVGMGRIGVAVAERLHPFGPRLVYWARRPVDPDTAARLGLEYVPFDHLLASATIVSLHVALTEETAGMIGAAQLAQMRQGALLINTGRGDLIDEVALRDAIKSGHLGGAGLDVLREERAGGNPFADLPNVIVTPHTAGASRDSIARVFTMTAANIRRVLAGEPPAGLIPGSAPTVRPLAR